VVAVAGLARDDLTKALFERSVVQGTLMRSTIHMVSAADYCASPAGSGGPARMVSPDARQGGRRHRLNAVATVVRGLLADGPRRRSELVKALEETGFPAVAWSGAGLWVDMVRVPPSGTWERRRADLFGLAETWMGSDDARDDGPDDILERREPGCRTSSAGTSAASARPPSTTSLAGPGSTPGNCRRRSRRSSFAATGRRGP